MIMKTYFFNRLIVLGLAVMTIGNAWGATTYTFTSKAWADDTKSWSSGKDGNGFTKGQGIQVTTGASGANATTKSSVSGITKIEVKYCTNSSDGVGTIKVQVGSNTEQSFSVTKPSKGTGTTLKTATFNFSPAQSGTVKVTCNCTTNSVYINSVTITAGSTWKLMGLGDWSTGLTFDSNGECTKDLAENTTYSGDNGFKICKDGSSWYGNGGTMNDGNCTGWEFTSSGGNCAITSGAAGTYTFKMTVNGSGNPVLTVTYPAPVWRLAGFNDWSHPIEFVNGTCTKTLEAKTYNQNTDAGFKVVKNSAAYYGANSTMTRSNASGIEWTFNGDQNCGITADVAGTYTFTINTSGSTPKVTVTYPKVLSSISVKTAPTKTSYIEGQYFDPTGLVITKTYSDASTEDVSYASSASAFTFSPTTSTALTTSNDKVTITVGGKSVEQTITVNAKSLSSIAVKTAPTKVDYEVNENFNPAGLVIKLTYNDASTEDVAYSGHESSFSFNPSTSTALQTSHTKVTITYGGKSVDQSITVKQYWTVSFFNNSQSIAGTEFAERKIEHNGEVGTLPTLKSSDACDATSRVFMGWTTQTISSKTSTAPTFVTATTKVTQNMVLRAVWARQQ